MALNTPHNLTECRELLMGNDSSDNHTWKKSANCTTDQPLVLDIPLAPMTIAMVTVYGIICVVGLLGNGLVIFVITRYTKMKTVTNMYILNLSIADFIFLMGLPMIITTMILRHWVFGAVFCKVYYIFTCVNMFTGAYTLTVMSGDRFLAVCYPISSMRYRVPMYARFAITVIWVVSTVVTIPVVLYTDRVDHRRFPDKYSCKIQWPAKQEIAGQKAYTLYSFLLGFVLPVLLISVFYTLLVVRLRTTGPQIKSADKKRSHRKVTTLVTLIIAVYVVCWLPYWIFQLYVIASGPSDLPFWVVSMFACFSVLSYANSMINPLLYAFMNENFRESFINAFHCMADPILGGRRTSEYYSSIANNNSVCTTGLNRRYNALNQTELSALSPKQNGAAVSVAPNGDAETTNDIQKSGLPAE